MTATRISIVLCDAPNVQLATGHSPRPLLQKSKDDDYSDDDDYRQNSQSYLCTFSSKPKMEFHSAEDKPSKRKSLNEEKHWNKISTKIVFVYSFPLIDSAIMTEMRIMSRCVFVSGWWARMLWKKQRVHQIITKENPHRWGWSLPGIGVIITCFGPLSFWEYHSVWFSVDWPS